MHHPPSFFHTLKWSIVQDTTPGIDPRDLVYMWVAISWRAKTLPFQCFVSWSEAWNLYSWWLHAHTVCFHILIHLCDLHYQVSVLLIHPRWRWSFQSQNIFLSYRQKTFSRLLHQVPNTFNHPPPSRLLDSWSPWSAIWDASILVIEHSYKKDYF